MCGEPQKEINSSSTQSFHHHHFLPKRDIIEKLRFRVLQNIILHRKARSGNKHSRTMDTTQSEARLISSLLSQAPQLQEESDPVRIGKVQKKNLPRPPLLHKKGAPADIGRDRTALVLAGQLTGPFSWPLQLEAQLSGLSGYSATRLKLPKDDLNHAKLQMGITQDPFLLGTMQQLCYNSIRSPLIKPTSQCEVKVPKSQESMMTSEVSSMLSEGTIELGPGNKGILYISLPDSQEKWGSYFIMNLKPLNQYITCTKLKMTTLKQIREAIHPGQWASSLYIKSAYFHIPIARRHHCFLHFQWKGKIYQFKTFLFGLTTAPKTFTMVIKPMPHLC